jgi:hypothetical protein
VATGNMRRSPAVQRILWISCTRPKQFYDPYSKYFNMVITL